MPVILCDCCGLQIPQKPPAEKCPRCGYPVDSDKETLFLQRSIEDLQRVAAHGGAQLSVAELIRRYQQRITALQQLKETRLAAVSVAEPALPVLSEKVVLPEQVERVLPSASLPEQKHVEDIPLAGVGRPVAVRPEPVVPPERPAKSFSWRTLLEDQTINILASLGAFLLLVGSLSFVATTTNLALSFFTMFAVHALFGITGAICYRWQSFRVVAIIYTAIFALLVPLVGFSSYRLAVGQLIALPTMTLVAFAAVYAAIVYGLLAIYQRFVLFSYLSIVACVVADVATAAALHLGVWWWPGTLGVLALPAVVSLSSVSGGIQPFGGRWLVLRDAVRWLMISCIGVCAIGVLMILAYMQGLDSSYQAWLEARWALCMAALLLVVWTALCLWRTGRAAYALALPWLFLLFALCCVYALQAQPIVYAVALTGIACLYHLFNRTVVRRLPSVQGLVEVNDILALILVGIVPFIVQPDLPMRVIVQAGGNAKYAMTATLGVGLVTIMVGCGLVLSIVFSHTGWRRVLHESGASWCWWLVLGGFLLDWAFAMVVCWLNVDLMWAFLGLALVFIAGAVVARRWLSAQWANPLDVLALAGICQTLVFEYGHSAGQIAFLGFLLTALSYGVLVYQRRYKGLFITLLLASRIILPLLVLPHILFLTCLALPLVAALMRRFVTDRWRTQSTSQSVEQRRVWEWPLVAMGIGYGLILLTIESWEPSGSIVGYWLHVTFPASLEVALLALAWYGSSVLSRVRWWLVIAVVCGFVSVVMSRNAFETLVWLGPLLIIAGVAQSRIMGKIWAAPLYVTAIWTAVVMGVVGYNLAHVTVTVGALLVFALCVYLAGVWEHSSAFMWAGPLFATWSVYYAVGLLGDLYRPLVMAVLCTTVGVGIGCLCIYAPALVERWQMPDEKRRNWLLRYALPWYATALASAILTGVYGNSFWIINYPFYTAIPDMLLLYACIAYVVALFERKKVGQWLVVGFGVWATVLAMRIATTPSQIQDVLLYLTGIVIGACCLGLLTGRIFNERLKVVENTVATPGGSRQRRYTWNWSWYVVMFVGMAVTVQWSFSVRSALWNPLVLAILGLFIALTLLVTLVERMPELVAVACILTVQTIARTEWLLWQQMIAYSLVCVLVFAAQFVWSLPSMPARGQQWHRLLGLGGQLCVVLAIIERGGLIAESGVLAQVGIGALLVLAGLLFWYGRLQAQWGEVRWCNYGAGLLIACAVSWELVVLHQTEIDWLTLAPATYLIVIAPFLARDENIAAHRIAGRYCSFVGAALLLLPTLWLSFSEINWQPTLILGGEALALLFLGVVMRVRFFVLSGAALVIVTAIHALFLPALGIPLSAALAVIGGLLLAIATGLSLARHRLRSAWMQWQ